MLCIQLENLRLNYLYVFKEYLCVDLNSSHITKSYNYYTFALKMATGIFVEMLKTSTFDTAYT
jgi:hypothetical protein